MQSQAHLEMLVDCAVQTSFKRLLYFDLPMAINSSHDRMHQAQNSLTDVCLDVAGLAAASMRCAEARKTLGTMS